MSSPAGPLTLRAYARHRGVSLRAVQKAIRSGRISTREDGRIDAGAADADWARNTAPRPQPAGQPSPSRNPHSIERITCAPIPRDSVDSPSRTDSGGVEYARARAVREGYLARLTKIDYEERSGKLISRDEVEVAAFNKYRTFRDGMLNIPDRLAAMLAAENSPVRVHELLTAEIRKALQEFSDANG